MTFKNCMEKIGYAATPRIGLAGLLGALCLGMVACSPSTNDNADAGDSSSTEQGRIAIAELSPASGSDVSGTVTFVEESDGIRVIADVQGISPGPHGFHIHENGDCSAADATSAGGHFNPTGAPHSGPDAAKRHVGDLGNLDVAQNETASYERVDTHLSFDGATSIIGKAVIIHAARDDLETQPTGAAGERIACGVIRYDS
ncbi:superoxide dismutase family protein [Pelagicoccus sp. SDUM812003]|uniref:superoxide dismutase family protein n=1 Tax=Pelagicoccus sp. SDUM812003 TaxID=3041267 RepID=UPI00280FA44A|nr:superoxide dismutase family protein [Pelagicoccus sp. SDUM812003]MDQ8204357.1 superoxide dismutase family protein [Pelagicoccus sp. SDUM812003]